jgi:peptide deformylase
MIITDEKLLRVKCEDVLPEEVDTLIIQLEKALDESAAHGQPGIGLSGPQIGLPKNVAIVRIPDLKISLNLINAKITKKYDEAVFSGEGCLSFPGQYYKTMRYQEIVVHNDIEPKRFIATGIVSTVIQHELDHLEGRLLPDFKIN